MRYSRMRGSPNVGKSSLFNALLNANRAIVSAVPGTTRDLLTERADIRGMSIALIDTAGIRESADVVEQEGVARARGAAEAADLLLVVLDASRPLDDEDRAILASTASQARVVVLNKIDLPRAHREPGGDVELSVRTGAGLDALADHVAARLAGGSDHRDQPRVTNVRHIALLDRAHVALTRARDAVQVSSGTMPEEFLLADLQDAAAALQEVTGKRSSNDLLRHIFERFCIGK
jgi:tRNA modification GTPase